MATIECRMWMAGSGPRCASGERSLPRRSEPAAIARSNDGRRSMTPSPACGALTLRQAREQLGHGRAKWRRHTGHTPSQAKDQACGSMPARQGSAGRLRAAGAGGRRMRRADRRRRSQRGKRQPGRFVERFDSGARRPNGGRPQVRPDLNAARMKIRHLRNMVGYLGLCSRTCWRPAQHAAPTPRCVAITVDRLPLGQEAAVVTINVKSSNRIRPSPASRIGMGRIVAARAVTARRSNRTGRV